MEEPMKLFCIIIAASLLSVCRADGPIGPPVGNQLMNDVRARDAARQAEAREQARRNEARPPTYGEWIEGKVIQVVKEGLIVDVTPKHYDPFLNFERRGEFKAVLLMNYPHQEGVVDGQQVGTRASAVGRYQYVAVSGATRTIERYDVAEVSRLEAREWQRVQEAFAQKRLLAEKAADRARTERAASVPRLIAFQLQQASNGLPSFQYIVGQRYLKGDGVETNAALAREWFTKAAAQGDSQAKKALAEMKR
jgi:hypothetical protein